MKKSVYLIGAIALCTMSLFSCKKEKDPGLDAMTQGSDFFPLEIGKYITYHVDSVTYNDFLGVAIPTSYLMRYETVDTFRDNQGRLSYTINIYQKKDNDSIYAPSDVIHVTRTETGLYYNQKNLNFLKLAFPIANGTSWNGNSMISANDQSTTEYTNYDWNYVYANFDQNYDAGAVTYPHTVTVNQIDDKVNDPDSDSTVYASRNYAQEVYAFGIGMIYRERIYWTFQPSANGQGGSGYKSGYSVIMYIVDHN